MADNFDPEKFLTEDENGIIRNAQKVAQEFKKCMKLYVELNSDD